MKSAIICILFLVPMIVNGQLEKAFNKLLNDKSSIYIDSTILYVTDTNNRNRAMQPHGVWRIRDVGNTRLLSITSNFDGKMHGHALGFYPNGQIAHSMYYNFDTLTGPSVSFWQNGSPQTSLFYENGVVEGVVRSYDTSAQLVKIAEVTKGKKEGIEIEFYSNGDIKSVTQFLGNKETGIRKEYKEGSNLQVVVEYDMKDGVRTVGRFYQDGKLIKTEDYR